jgi:hypothetical protein
LRKQGERFVVKAGDKEFAVSAHKVQGERYGGVGSSRGSSSPRANRRRGCRVAFAPGLSPCSVTRKMGND